MATNTYVALDTQVLTSSAASVTFSSIPQGYTDLIIVGNVTPTAGTETICLRFNGDTGANYSFTYLYGNGSAAASGRATNTSFALAGLVSASEMGNFTAHVMNYSNSSTYKTVLDRRNLAGLGAFADVSLWRSTSAITSLTLFPENSRIFQAGSTFTVYGIAADDGTYSAKATGGTITTDQFYVYHTFTSSGTFSPTANISADVLVIAGGGGSPAAGTGAGPSGGGGAGGVLGFTGQSLTPSSYTVTVGAGGTNTTGNDSQFGTLTLVKGGGIGGTTDNIGGTGGSGGGSGGRYTSAGGAATSGQGNTGGVGYQQSGLAAGAGGGAGAVGGPAGNNQGGTGGAGTNAYSSWATATSTGASGYYAGGGGGMSWYSGNGGAGGTGGGGNGASNSTATNATNGTANTGGGGGGSSYGSTGGSGLVIVRYSR